MEMGGGGGGSHNVKPRSEHAERKTLQLRFLHVLFRIMDDSTALAPSQAKDFLLECPND